MPLVYYKHLPFETMIGIWKVEEKIEELRNKLILNKEELDFFHSLQKGKRNLHWLSSRVLIRQLLNTKDFIRLESDQYGKPHLINLNYDLSISHSFEYAAVILSRHKVGIDIELIKPKVKWIVHKFINEDENPVISEKYPLEHMYVYWGGKESMYKLYGKRKLNFRENMKLESFRYQKDGGSVKGRIVNWEIDAELMIHYMPFNGYMLTYVIEGEN